MSSSAIVAGAAAPAPLSTHKLARLAGRSSENLMRASIIFWGVWLLPLGWLAIRSRLVPRTLGLLLMLGAPYYLAFYVGLVFQPDYEKTLLAQVVGIRVPAPRFDRRARGGAVAADQGSRGKTLNAQSVTCECCIHFE
jgi:hypothetical protein